MTTPTTDAPRILIFGAASAIAREVARRYAARGARLFLVARNPGHLQELVADLQVRGALTVDVAAADLTHRERHGELVDTAFTTLGGIDVGLICHGSLPDQAACEQDPAKTLHEIEVNGVSVVSLLSHLAPRMATQRGGILAAITSVAGDRGRQSNYVYGSAKALVSTYLEGLRGRLLRDGVHVVDIRPGFVDTPMTAAFKKGALWASPGQVAEIIVNAIDRKKHTVYAPFFWRFIMLVVKAVPAPVFKYLKF